MTRDEFQAGILLGDAIDALPALKSALERTEPEAGNYRALEISVGDHSDAGASHDADVKVDIETGRLIVVEVERIIRERAKALGVEHSDG